MKMRYHLFAALALVSVVTGAAKADQLINNGDLITGTVNGHNVSQLATNQGYTTIGYGTNNNASPAIRMADDFTVTAGETWQLSDMRWFSYQTGSSLTSTLTGAYVTIYAGSPTGTVVAGNYTTNRLTSSAFSGIYRTTDTNTADTSRPIMELNIDMSWVPELSGGTTYWIGVGLTGSLSSGPWSPPVTPIATGNAMQTVDGGGTWNTVLDSGHTQEMPFKLNGSVISSAVPEAGTLALVLPALGIIGAVIVRRKK